MALKWVLLKCWTENLCDIRAQTWQKTKLLVWQIQPSICRLHYRPWVSEAHFTNAGKYVIQQERPVHRALPPLVTHTFFDRVQIRLFTTQNKKKWSTNGRLLTFCLLCNRKDWSFKRFSQQKQRLMTDGHSLCRHRHSNEWVISALRVQFCSTTATKARKREPCNLILLFEACVPV